MLIAIDSLISREPVDKIIIYSLIGPSKSKVIRLVISSMFMEARMSGMVSFRENLTQIPNLLMLL